MIGTISDYIKNFELNMKWQEKKKSPFSMVNAPSLLDSMKPDEDTVRWRLEAITSKLKSGREISYGDLAFLEKYAPDLAQKARAIKQEREQYRRDLERCRSKEEARDVRNQKKLQLCTEAGGIASAPTSADGKQAAMEFIDMRSAAIDDEHATFTRSQRYQLLPQRRRSKREAAADATDQLRRNNDALKRMLKTENDKTQQQHSTKRIRDNKAQRFSVQHSVDDGAAYAADTQKAAYGGRNRALGAYAEEKYKKLKLI
jgi:hypothetical protein